MNKGLLSDTKSSVQSVLFSRKKFTPDKARRWLRKHKKVPIKRVDKTEKYLRYRLIEPTFKEYRTDRIADGVMFVYGITNA